MYLTKFIPYTKFWALDKIKHLLREPILDLGCHIGDTFWYMKISGDITGVDIFEQYFQICLKRKIYRRLIQMDLSDLSEDFGRYGSVTAFFLLEHMSRGEGLELLRKMEVIAGNVIVMLPYGESPQESPDGNPYQKHVSVWYPEDFVRRGFRIVSICRQLTVRKIPNNLILAVRDNEKA